MVPEEITGKICLRPACLPIDQCTKVSLPVSLIRGRLKNAAFCCIMASYQPEDSSKGSELLRQLIYSLIADCYGVPPPAAYPSCLEHNRPSNGRLNTVYAFLCVVPLLNLVPAQVWPGVSVERLMARQKSKEKQFLYTTTLKTG